MNEMGETAGPIWIGDNRAGYHDIGGRKVDFVGDPEPQEFLARLVGRRVVGARLESDYLAYLRLDDGTHIGFQGISAQSTDLLIVHMWDDKPPKP